jgi:hypothetical protein
MIRRFIAGRLRKIARAATRIADRLAPVHLHPMEIHLGQPLTAEGAAEIAKALQRLIEVRAEKREAT